MGSIAIGGPPVRVTVRERYQNVRLRFSGTAGERISINATEIVPISSFVGIARADGTFLPNADYVLRLGCFDGCFVADTLPATGAYMIVVDPELDEVGSMTLTVTHALADVAETIVAGGSPVITANTAPGQRMRLGFDGTAGQRVSFKVTGSVSIFTEIFLQAPNGSILAQGQLNSGLNYIDALTLPTTGVYHIIVEPHRASVGNATVTLYNVVDLLMGATIGGSPVNLTFSTPGQNGRVTVDAVAGQRIGAQLSAVTVSSSLVSVVDPTGATIVAPTFMTTGGMFVDWVAATTGTYTIVVDPQRDNTGSLTLTVTAPPADVTGTLTPGGAPLTITVSTPGQNAQVTFTATAGQRVSLGMTSVTIASSTVTIRKPNGGTLASTIVSTSGGFIDTNALVDAGTYTIVVDPSGNNTGSMTLTLHNVPADASVGATVDGAPVTVTAGTPGEGVLITFAGAANRHVAINLTAVSISSSNVSLLNPDGSLLLAPVSVTTSGRFLDAVLTTAGTYSLRIDPVGTATGSMTATLTTVPADVTGSILPDGSPVTVSITSAGQNAHLTFTGAAGQRVSLRLTSVTIATSTVTILKPDGTSLATTTVTTSGGFIDTNVLATSGTYTIVVNPTGAAIGNMTLTLYDVPSDLTGTITPGGPPVTVSIGTVGQNAKLTFTGSIAQRISLRVSSVTLASVTVSILGPTGVPISGGTITVGTSGGFIDLKTLQANGSHTVSVNPATSNTGSLTLTLYAVPLDATATVTVDGPAAPVTVDTPGQNAAVTFDGTIGQSVTVRLTGNSIGTFTVKLLRPDNTTMTSATSSASSFNLTAQTIGITGPYCITIDPVTTNVGTITVAVTTQ